MKPEVSSFRTFALYCSLVIAAYLSLTKSSFAEAALKSLPGHVPAVVSKLTAVGNLDPASSLQLAIGVSLRDPRSLSNFLSRLYDPSDPTYHHYLTVSEFTERFGPTTNNYSAVMAFAQRNNLKITTTHTNRLLLDVTGTVSNIQSAFHIHLKTYHHPTEARDFYSPDTEPSVDSSLAIADVSGLNNYSPPHPNFILEAQPAVNAVPRSGAGPSGTYEGSDFRAAYLPGVTLTGSGQTIGLLEFDGFYASDITSYESQNGLPAIPIQTVLLNGYSGTPTTGSKSGNPEVSLDIEMAMAMAPGISSIVSYEAGPSGTPNTILNAMVANTAIKQFSSSWGWAGGPSTTTDAIFQEMQTQGQSYYNAAGDSDAFTSGASSANGVDNPSLDQTPASSPYITQVGGTTLTTSGPAGAWVSETVWNWGLYEGSYVGTCGGISSHYAIPTWQEGVNMSTNGGSTAQRNIPDVALTADNIYVTYGNGATGTFGGTSCAAPLWAGVTALMNEQAVSKGDASVGFINPMVYAIGESGAYSSSFHDITTGNNTSSASPDFFYAFPGYDLCTGWGTPAGQPLIDALAGAPNPLVLSPVLGFSASGPLGGPFSDASQNFVLSNAISSNLTWSVLTPDSWLTASPSTGTLAGNGSTNVVISLTAAAASLPAGVYTSEVTFSNWNSIVGQSVLFKLSIDQSLVQNGGFETGAFTDWTLVGNTVIRNTIYDAVLNSSYGLAVIHSGSYGAALGNVRLATLSQTLTTTPGENYLLSFWLDNLASGSGQEFLANWNGANLYFVTNPPAFTWTNIQFIVSSPGSNTVLEFGAQNSSSYFGLDDISVTPIAAPSFASPQTSTGTLTFTWSATIGVTYQVQSTTDLLSAVWTDYGPPIAATSNSISISDTNLTATNQLFFRLLLVP
jgi:hypothetical protein